MPNLLGKNALIRTVLDGNNNRRVQSSLPSFAAFRQRDQRKRQPHLLVPQPSVDRHRAALHERQRLLMILRLKAILQQPTGLVRFDSAIRPLPTMDLAAHNQRRSPPLGTSDARPNTFPKHGRFASYRSEEHTSELQSRFGISYA